MSVGRQLPRFVVAGAIGFVVDAGVLYAALAIGLDYYTGRLASFFAAVVTTWLINRRWTFDAAQTQPTVAEFVRYFGAMSLGGAVNYATYAVIVAAAPRAAWLPLVAVAAGSIAGLGVNFATARLWVFASATAGARAADSPEPGSNSAAGVPAAQAWPAAAFWTALAAGLLTLKLIGLALDPQPQFFLGDSASYVHTAPTDWVPTDRSHWYGEAIRTITGHTQSLAPLLLAQAAAGAVSAWLAAYWAQIVFAPRRAVLVAVAVVCALDPSQLLLERYVTTEAFALLFLAAMMVALAFVIVRGGWYWTAAAVVAATGLVALRMSLLPVAVAGLALAPVLAWSAGSLRLHAAVPAWLLATLFVPLASTMMNTTQSGAFMLAACSPLLKAQDFPDPAMGERVLRGLDVTDPKQRESNLYDSGGLLHRLAKEIGNAEQADHIARATGMRIALRDPFGVAALGWRTYSSLWDRDTRLRLMRWDVGKNPERSDFRETMARREYRHRADEPLWPTLTSRLYLSAGLWTAAGCLVAPLLLAGATIGQPRAQMAALLFLASAGLLLLIVGAMTTPPVVRYLHPLGWMLCAGALPAVVRAWLRRPAS